MSRTWEGIVAAREALTGADEGAAGQNQRNGRYDGSEAARGSGGTVPWPTLDRDALTGLAGAVVATAAPQTEADEAALLNNFLVYFGNAAGRSPHALVGNKRHGTNISAVLVGRTSGGRKGTSRAVIDDLFDRVEPVWFRSCVQTGLSTGEGLISAVRDAATKTDEQGHSTVLEEGVSDKRLLVVEEEFCGPIKVMAREGNTLSAVLRQAWDGQDLSTLTRHSPMRATKPHVSVLGHITQTELLKYMTETEMANGFANRFLWICVKRSKFLPDGGEAVSWRDLVEQVKKALAFAGAHGAAVTREAAAKSLWHRTYPRLTAERAGLFGAVTSRAEAQALRLSVLYALLARSTVVAEEHLRAALALWKYCQDSARFIFGDAIGDRIADRLLGAIRDAGAAGLDMEDTHHLFGRNVSKDRREAALATLMGLGLIERHTQDTEGRARTVFRDVQFGGAR